MSNPTRGLQNPEPSVKSRVPFNIVCVKCCKSITDLTIDTCPVLFRERIMVRCHGDIAVVERPKFVGPGDLVEVFGGGV